MLPFVAALPGIIQGATGLLTNLSGTPQAEQANALAAQEQQRRWLFGGLIFGGLIVTALVLSRR